MDRQRVTLISVFIIILLGLCGWMVYSGVIKTRSMYVAGAPPSDLVNAVLPQTVDLNQMRPPAPRTTDFMRYGGVTSSASVIMFGDYNCADCKKLESSLRQVLPKYNGAVRYIWRDLPQSQGKYDIDAAIYAYCAGMQNRFWETHDALMILSPNLDDFALNDLTVRLKLDSNALASCRMDPKVKATIQYDAMVAGGDGVTSTPILFIGTQASKGYLPADEVDKRIKLFLGS